MDEYATTACVCSYLFMDVVLILMERAMSTRDFHARSVCVYGI